ncbi:MAG: hypothetical protein VX294_08980 [Candidatus Latescibacterota bacterium]|nr:hypothetical protein [Candidatus Latescibacterota bacterium]
MQPSEIYRASDFADALPELGSRGATPERLKFLDEHGYLIINDFVDSPWVQVLREAGRRVSDACAPSCAYDKIELSKGYVHRTTDEDPWAIRGLIHPAFGEPCFAEFHGSDEFMGFVDEWCGGITTDELTLSGMLLWTNPRQGDHKLGWHRDVTWWGSGKPYVAQRKASDENIEDYSEERERVRWEEIRAENKKSVCERKSVNMFLALVDDECHELIPGSHNRWRSSFEHDVLLPKSMKEKGVPYTPSWNGKDPLPGQVAVRLRAGEALIRMGSNIHTGHTVPTRERNTLAIGWSRWQSNTTGSDQNLSGIKSKSEKPKRVVADARHAWQLDPEVRESLPHSWMQSAWDRWAETQKLGDTLEDRYAPFDISRIKSGQAMGWNSPLEKRAAQLGEEWAPRQTLSD